ncbi:UvrD-helicase domain-containing protein [Novilysobacter antarcticus]|uniref:UvrD-helicase domain-containing protein n=1 Tax=Novilysobacter antarcticus TaxID=2862543 RepID=UPI001C996008|nr:UvrD-helicase domain-containing protein [Lysobacter antarcticus]
MTEAVVALDDKVDEGADATIRECLNLSTPRSFFLYAGAGSGKTRSLVEAVRYLRVRERQRLVFKAQRIAIITYTNAACDEISRRLEFDPLVDVSTIHAFAWRLIKGFNTDIREWVRRSVSGDIQKLDEQLSKSRGENKTTIARREERGRKQRRLDRLDDIRQFIYSPTGENRGRDSLNHSEVIQMAAAFLQDPPLRDVLVDLHPVLLIDESQDTNRHLMDALLAVQKSAPERFCLGLFGDTMQRIYNDGKERLEDAISADWARPAKRMNYRCPKRVVRLINQIRADVDDQVQQPLAAKIEGTVRLFVTGHRAEPTFELEESIAGLMAQASGDQAWCEGEAKRKTLILEHKMAARRMEFEGVFSPLYAAEHLRTGLLDGTLPGVKFFFESVMPIVDAGLKDDGFALVDAVRTRSPLLDLKLLASSETQLDLLENAGAAATSLTDLFKDRDPLLFDVVGELLRSALLDVPESIGAACTAGVTTDDPPETTDRNLLEVHAYRRVLGVKFSQMRRFANYAAGLSPFDTHQGVKGLEFPRVMVVISDGEAGGFMFSYEKLLGITEPTPRDIENENEGKDSSLSRTRRLLYVTCSRAEESLALVVYSSNPVGVRDWVVREGWFESKEVVLLDE